MNFDDSELITNYSEFITMNDFKKYATKHLGMSSMVLDDVMKAQSQYLNP